MDMNALTGLACIYGRGRRKVDRRKQYARKPSLIHILCEPVRLHIRRPDYFKGRRRPPPLREIGALKQAGSRIQQSRFKSGQPHTWHDPYISGLRKEHTSVPSCNGYNRKRKRIPLLPADHARQFSHGKTIPHAQRICSDKTLIAFLQNISFHQTSQRIYSVQNNQLHLPSFAFLTGIIHRGDKRIVPRAHILNIIDQGIDSFQHLLRKTFGILPVKAVHHNTGIRILTGIYHTARRHISSHSVLRRIEC